MVTFFPVKMSCILIYFTYADIETSSKVDIPTAGFLGISDKKILKMADQVRSTSGVKRKRVTFNELDKMKITKYANECGIANSVVNY